MAGSKQETYGKKAGRSLKHHNRTIQTPRQ